MDYNGKTVVVALSGGVDSSVAAMILKQQGYRVIGAFMKCFSDTKNKYTGECAWKDERRMAIRVAAKLGIPLMTLDFEKEYRKDVIEPMFKAYAKGLTPNPDILCNTIVKFPLLWKAARKIGADFIATGHYARIRKDWNGYALLKGKDRKKDQSYFLAELTQGDLNHTLFPVGRMTKEKVRAAARKSGLPNWNKQGTRGICFVGKQDMRVFLQRKIPKKEGKAITPDGDVIGTHAGMGFYTIGQKTGEHAGIFIKKPKGLERERFYVAEKKKQGNILVVAPEGHEALKKKEVILRKFHLVNPKDSLRGALKARIRNLGELHSGILGWKNGLRRFVFSKPVDSIALGQFLVIYRGEKVLGCGEICKAEN